MSKNNKLKDTIIMGFALFAIFFGAGNLIFPPYLGVISGSKWYLAMAGFLSTDPVIPILGLIVTATVGGQGDSLGKRVHPLFSKTIAAICVLMIGTIFAVPRTASVTHTMLVTQFAPGAPQIATSVVFFGLTIYLAINPGKVIDIVGKFLTPVLVVILAIVIIRSIFMPGVIMAEPDPTVTNAYLRGFTEGYQTMDGLGCALMAGLVYSDLVRRGYTEEKDQLGMMIGTGVVAFILLAFVYGGLTFAGATISTEFGPDADRTALILELVSRMMGGNIGKLLIGIATALACLTTSIGLTSTVANYFEGISGGKLKYKTLVLVSAVIAFCISLFGTDKIIVFAVPVLSLVFPFIICLVFFTIFDKVIKYNATYIGAMVGVAPVAVISALALAFQIAGTADQNAGIIELNNKINALPFGTFAMPWIVPALACALVFTVVAFLMDGSKSK